MDLYTWEEYLRKLDLALPFFLSGAAKGEHVPLLVSKHCPPEGRSRSRTTGTGWVGLSSSGTQSAAQLALTPSFDQQEWRCSDIRG